MANIEFQSKLQLGVFWFIISTVRVITVPHAARLEFRRNSSTEMDCCFSLLQEFHPAASRPRWSRQGTNPGMSRAIDCLSTEGRRGAVGFCSVSSRKWDQTYSQAARPATNSLGGQEITSDPAFYDPQLSAGGSMEDRAGEKVEKWPKNVTSLGQRYFLEKLWLREEKWGKTSKMTEMINQATVHKDSLHDTVCQHAFVYDQADFAAASLQETNYNMLFSRCTFEHSRVQIIHFRESGWK